MRVRQFTQDDAHIFCREDQIVEEVAALLRPARLRSTSDLGFADYAIKLALRPEQALRLATRCGTRPSRICATRSQLAGRDGPEYGWEELPGEGAFYAPKLEFHLTDAIGRTWQVGTLQLDYVLPERLDASYIGEDGEKPPAGHAPPRDPRHVRALHRHPDRASCRPLPALAGAGAGGGGDDRLRRRRLCARGGGERSRRPGLRVEADLRNEKINYKVREHSLAKVPYLLVVGKREAEERTVALRPLGEGAAAGGAGARRALAARLAAEARAARSARLNRHSGREMRARARVHLSFSRFID